MIINETPIPGAYLVEMQPFADDRGWFSRFYCKNEFAAIDFHGEWVQMNHSYTSKKGTVRGMHFQFPPHSEIKLVRCIRGKVFDVIVDLREGSDTFLKWFGIELSAENKKAIFIPEGIAHGFQTMENDCELIYCHSNFFAKAVEGGVRYNDPIVNIPWPLDVLEVSRRDKEHTLLDLNYKGLKLKK